MGIGERIGERNIKNLLIKENEMEKKGI